MDELIYKVESQLLSAKRLEETRVLLACNKDGVYNTQVHELVNRQEEMAILVNGVNEIVSNFDNQSNRGINVLERLKVCQEKMICLMNSMVLKSNLSERNQYQAPVSTGNIIPTCGLTPTVSIYVVFRLTKMNCIIAIFFPAESNYEC